MNGIDYEYVALDGEGVKQRGIVHAGSKQEAFRKVSSFKLTPLRLEPVSDKPRLFTPRKVTSKDIADLTYQLSVLVEARVPIAEGLMSIAEHESKETLRSMLQDVASKIESGLSITESLEEYSETFGDVYIETMRAAERSGNLIAVLNHLAQMLERQIESRRQLRQALSYPCIVLGVIAVAVTVLIVFVIPRFASTFAAQGVEMPLVTRILQGLGESMRAYWWAYVTAFVSIIVAFVMVWKRPAGRMAIEGILMRTPYVKSVIQAVTVGRFTRVLGLSLGSGLDVIECLELSGLSTGRPLFVHDTKHMVECVRRGEHLADVLRASGQLPGFARRMLTAGRDSDELSRSCEIVARHYEREAENLTKNVSTVIEPILTILLAGIVLVVALSVFLPMWSVYSSAH